MKGFSKNAQDRFVPDMLFNRCSNLVRHAEFTVTHARERGAPVRWDLVLRAATKADLCFIACRRLGWGNKDLEVRIAALLTNPEVIAARKWK